MKNKSLGSLADRDGETRRAPVRLPKVIRSLSLPPVDTNEALQGGAKHG